MIGLFKIGIATVLFSACSLIPGNETNIGYGNTHPRGNKLIKSFRRAKKILHEIIYRDHQITFYCGCTYNNKKEVNHGICGYSPRKNKTRAARIEWEHVVPAHRFGKNFVEWREGHPDCITKKGKRYRGRKCAARVNRLFKRMLADIYNLQPAIGEVNGDRSNYPMAIIPGEKRLYGRCDIEIEKGQVEPKENIRGNIARTYFYMAAVYPGKVILSHEEQKLFEQWHKADPVDEWECRRAEEIRKVQGNVNRVVEKACSDTIMMRKIK